METEIELQESFKEAIQKYAGMDRTKRPRIP